MIISKRSQLSTTIKNCIDEPDAYLPAELHFCEGLGEPKFEISIKIIEQDTFIDSEGNKWVKVNE